MNHNIVTIDFLIVDDCAKYVLNLNSHEVLIVRARTTRTYQKTISDALEACFSFKSLNLRDYLVEISSIVGGSHANALKTAGKPEDKASKFYLDAAEQSRSLLATIPRTFRKVAETRTKRKKILEALLTEA